MTPEGKAPKGNMPEKLIIAHSEYWGRVVISEDMIVNHTMQGRTIEHWVHESALLASEEKVKEVTVYKNAFKKAAKSAHKERMDLRCKLELEQLRFASTLHDMGELRSSLEKRLAEAEEREKKLRGALEMLVSSCEEEAIFREAEPHDLVKRAREALKVVVESEKGGAKLTSEGNSWRGHGHKDESPDWINGPFVIKGRGEVIVNEKGEIVDLKEK